MRLVIRDGPASFLTDTMAQEQDSGGFRQVLRASGKKKHQRAYKTHTLGTCKKPISLDCTCNVQTCIAGRLGGK